MMKKILLFAIILVSHSCAQENATQNEKTENLEINTVEENIVENDHIKKDFDVKNMVITNWVEDLEIPWSLVFLDNETALVSQRGGKISLIKNGEITKGDYWKADSAHIGEGGLMGIEKDPDFENNNFIYVMYTYTDKNGRLKNQVSRLIHNGDFAIKDKILIEDIDGSRFHNGGRIKFGPDNKLYITTGDAQNPSLAQNMDSYAGKVLRINNDGSIPEDNPFKNSAIFSLGHRNVQGIAFEPNTNDIFISNHGPSGEFGLRARDRVDHLKSGANYGRPEVAGFSQNFEDPIIYWDEKAVPPAGMVFWNGYLFVATLGSETLFKIKLKKENDEWKVTEKERLFEGVYGRLRDVVVGPDNALYILTSNKDGRGKIEENDDKIIKIEIR